MRNRIQKKRYVILLVAILIMGQIPSGFVSAAETTVVQDITQDESLETTAIKTSEETDNNEEVNESEVNEKNSIEFIDDKITESNSIDDNQSNGEHNELPTIPNEEELESQLQTTDLENFIIEGTTLTSYTGNAKSITIPNNVTIIGANAFEKCNNLTSVTIPNGVTTIKDYAFSECYNLTTINIPDSVTIIEKYVFFLCKNLNNVTIPDSVTSIGDYTFSNCYGLTTITLSNYITALNEGLFSQCESLTSLTIPASVTMIDKIVFFNCFNLTNLIIPDNVSIIKGNPFEKCNGLADENGFVIVRNTCYDYLGSDTDIIIPSGVTHIGEDSFVYNKSIINVVIPDGVTDIGDFSFYQCQNLTNIIIPSSVTSIGRYAFEACSNLQSLTFKSGLVLIKEHAFYRCKSLNDVTISDTVTTIEDYAFGLCENLKNINIPNNVNSMGENTFIGCNNRMVSYQNGIFRKPDRLEDFFSMYCSENSYAYLYAQDHNKYGIQAVTTQDVTSVSIDQNNITLSKGDSTTLVATILPYNATNKNITWSTSDSNIATIDNNGKVTALLPGTATITVTTDSGNMKATCVVTIIEQQTKVNSIILNNSNLTLAKKGSIQLVATIFPSNAANQNITWSSSNENIATVSSSGKILAISTGSTNITATAQDGSNVISICKVTVPKSKSYKITYKLNKGTNAATNPTYYAKGTTLKLLNPTRNNYSFIGWYLNNTKINSINKNYKGNITLIAKWEKVKVTKTTIKSVKNKEPGKASVEFNKLTNINGYTIYYSANKNLKDANTVNVSAKKKSATLTGLNKETTYYVKVKAYKIDSQGNKLYGKSSKIIKVKIKK